VVFPTSSFTAIVTQDTSFVAHFDCVLPEYDILWSCEPPVGGNIHIISIVGNYSNGKYEEGTEITI
jgi:hypothetical protein